MSDETVRCWRCKHLVPEALAVCNAGIGTQCRDAKACRGRWYGPHPARLDADGTAQPLTEIVGVYPPGDGRVRTLHHGMAERYVVRPTEAATPPPTRRTIAELRDWCAATLHIGLAKSEAKALLDFVYGDGEEP